MNMDDALREAGRKARAPHNRRVNLSQPRKESLGTYETRIRYDEAQRGSARLLKAVLAYYDRRSAQ